MAKTLHVLFIVKLRLDTFCHPDPTLLHVVNFESFVSKRIAHSFIEDEKVRRNGGVTCIEIARRVEF